MRQPEEHPDFSGEQDDHELCQHPSETGLSEMLLVLDAESSNQVGAGLGVVILVWESMCKRKLHLDLITSNPKVLLC